MAVQFFITNDRPNVSGLVLAGSADFKTDLGQSDMFDPRLQAVVLGSVDVSYGESAHVDLKEFLPLGCSSLHMLLNRRRGKRIQPSHRAGSGHARKRQVCAGEEVDWEVSWHMVQSCGDELAHGPVIWGCLI